MSMSAALLEAMLEHNSASLATLYQTGVFFFALAYCGSNLVEIGHLFKVCGARHAGSCLNLHHTSLYLLNMVPRSPICGCTRAVDG